MPIELNQRTPVETTVHPLLRRLTLVSALASVPMVGQSQTATARKDSVLNLLTTRGVDSATVGVPTYFVPGRREHAAQLGRMLADEIAFYRDSLGVGTELTLAVLDSTRWKLVNSIPYGMPNVGGGIVYFPATPDGVVAQSYARLKHRVPSAILADLNRQHLSWTRAVATQLDLVGFHEVGHSVVSGYGIRSPTLWLNEMLASYLGYAFMSARYPLRAKLWDEMSDADIAAHIPAHRSLKDFETMYSGVGADDYVWYQSEFQARIRAVFKAEGLNFVRRVRDEFPRTPAPWPDSLATRVNGIDDVLARLDRIAPGFVTWAQGFNKAP